MDVRRYWEEWSTYDVRPYTMYCTWGIFGLHRSVLCLLPSLSANCTSRLGWLWFLDTLAPFSICSLDVSI